MALFRRREKEDPNKEIREAMRNKKKAVFITKKEKKKDGTYREEETNILTEHGKDTIGKKAEELEMSDDITAEVLKIRKNGRIALATISAIGTAGPLLSILALPWIPWFAFPMAACTIMAFITIEKRMWNKIWAERMPVEPIVQMINERGEASIMENVTPGTLVISSKDGDRSIILDESKKITFKCPGQEIRGWLAHYACATALPEQPYHDSKKITDLVNGIMITRGRLKPQGKIDYKGIAIIAGVLIAAYVVYTALNPAQTTQAAEAVNMTTTTLRNLSVAVMP